MGETRPEDGSSLKRKAHRPFFFSYPIFRPTDRPADEQSRAVMTPKTTPSSGEVTEPLISSHDILNGICHVLFFHPASALRCRTRNRNPTWDDPSSFGSISETSRPLSHFQNGSCSIFEGARSQWKRRFALWARDLWDRLPGWSGARAIRGETSSVIR